MPFLEKIFHYAFGRKDSMANSTEFEPTDILYHRYQSPTVLIHYVKTLQDGFTNDNITVKVLKDGRLGLRLPRKLNKEEIDGALQAFIAAERARHMNDDE